MEKDSTTLMEGQLLKWINYAYGWQARYFKIEQGVLHYYKYTDKEKETTAWAKGTIHLQIATISTTPKDPLRILIDTGSKVLHLKAKTISEKQSWVDALRQSQEKFITSANDLDAKISGSIKLTSKNSKKLRQFLKRGKSGSSNRSSSDFERGPNQRKRSSGDLRPTGPALNRHGSQGADERDYFRMQEQNAANSELDGEMLRVYKLHSLVEDYLGLLKKNLDSYGVEPEILNLADKIESINFELRRTIASCQDIMKKQEKDYKKITMSFINETSHDYGSGRLSGLALGGDGTSGINDATGNKGAHDVEIDSNDDDDDESEENAKMQRVEKELLVEEAQRRQKSQEAERVLTRSIIENSTDDVDGEGDDEELEQGDLQSEVAQDGMMAHQADSTEPMASQSVVADSGAGVVNGPQPWRVSLPSKRSPGKDISWWKVIKDSIGKDLTKISMPISFNEPLSMLQKICEQFEYSNLLYLADTCDNDSLSLAYLTGFAIGVYANTQNRLLKPFNPILGETYQLDCQEQGFKFFAEQVSHHPPISAYSATAENFSVRGQSEFTNRFWGKYMEMTPKGTTHVTLATSGKQYYYSGVTTILNNILMGTAYIEHHGELVIKCVGSKAYASVLLKKKGLLSGNGKEVKGKIVDENGKTVYELIGEWDKYLNAKDKNSGEIIEIFKKNPTFNDFYYLSAFGIHLNEPVTAEESLLRSDSRLRPDQRLHEKGDMIEAAEVKNKLEDRQRKAKKLREREGTEYEPRWFTLIDDEITQEEVYAPKEDFWQASTSGVQLEGIPEVFNFEEAQNEAEEESKQS